MIETAKARVAWNDYVELGEKRSFYKLLGGYRSDPKSAPTVRLRTLKIWSVAFEWQARLAGIAEAERAAIVARGIADKQNRVNALNERWELMKRVVGERAVAEEMQRIAGGKTGLLAHDVKGVGKGDDFQLVDVYEVDTGLLRELREHEMQAAKEMGQWAERRELSGPDGGAIVVKSVRELTDDELANIAGRGGAGAIGPETG